MSLQTRLAALISALGADIKDHETRIDALELGGGGGGGGGMNYIGPWVAGTYPAQTLTTHLGSLSVSKVSTSEEPVPPTLNYSNDFATVPSESFWAQSGVGAGESITAIGGQTVGTSGKTTALRLFGVGTTSGGDFYIQAILEWIEAGNVTFWDSISSENGWDKGYFYIDGVQQYTEISGTVGWTQRSFGVSAGVHTLRWRYAGDSGAAGNDNYLIGALSTTGTFLGSEDWDAIAFTPSKILELIAEATA